MFALSIRQPYAEQILRGTKINEIRTRRTHVRGCVYIYAPKSWDTIPDDLPDDLDIGCIVGTVEITGCTKQPDGRWHWNLINPKRLDVPIVPTRHPQPSFFNPFN